MVFTWLVSMIGMVGLGPALVNDPFDKKDLTFFNEAFKGKVDSVYYFTSFYIFLNISAIPVLTLVLRNNLIYFLTP